MHFLMFSCQSFECKGVGAAVNHLHDDKLTPSVMPPQAKCTMFWVYLLIVSSAHSLNKLCLLASLALIRAQHQIVSLTSLLLWKDTGSKYRSQSQNSLPPSSIGSSHLLEFHCGWMDRWIWLVRGLAEAGVALEYIPKSVFTADEQCQLDALSKPFLGCSKFWKVKIAYGSSSNVNVKVCH